MRPAVKDVILTVALLGIGFGAGWIGCASIKYPSSTHQVPVQTDSATCSTEIVPAPKNVITLPDGTRVESDQPIDLDIQRSGPGSSFAASGEARSPGIRTNASEQALQMALESGTPILVRPDGSMTAAPGKGGGGSFDLKLMGGGGGYFLLVAGVLVLAATGYGIYRIFPISRKQAVLIGAIGGTLGAVLIVAGLNPDLFAYCVMGGLGVAVVGGVAYAWHMGAFAKTVAERDATDRLAGKLAIAVDESDDGQYDTLGKPLATNAGGRVKAMVKTMFKGDTEMEAAIDSVKKRYGA